ncbi:hypothetical protein L1S35_06580 [Flavobacterium sp. AS60]|uniref:hypothetical protein n=1 Tax=Flavobacterium anseongense TaxID=2910677 RepID=UPI001F309107|nr:hypothetical protein [Flavobacterium sp. AS60]MCF6129332.1 hypothetical protein [Flavobacterium sp. AS60]
MAMTNIENKKISILTTIIALIFIIFFSIIKVNTELTEIIDGNEAITTTSKIILLGNEYNFESSIAVCFALILISVIAFFYTTDTQIKSKAIDLKNKTIAFATSLKDKQNRAKLKFYIITIVIIVLCWKALAYYDELKDLEKENHYVVFNKWQASFMGFMRVGQIALPILILFKIIGLIIPKKKK